MVTVSSTHRFMQTQRTIAVIKALGAVAPAIVSRKVYYPGGKHLVNILQLLLPGIDLVRLLFRFSSNLLIYRSERS